MLMQLKMKFFFASFFFICLFNNLEGEGGGGGVSLLAQPNVQLIVGFGCFNHKGGIRSCGISCLLESVGGTSGLS